MIEIERNFSVYGNVSVQEATGRVGCVAVGEIAEVEEEFVPPVFSFQTALMTGHSKVDRARIDRRGDVAMSGDDSQGTRRVVGFIAGFNAERRVNGIPRQAGKALTRQIGDVIEANSVPVAPLDDQKGERADGDIVGSAAHIVV